MKSLTHAEIKLFQLGIMPPDIKYFCDYNMIHVLQVFNGKKNFLLFSPENAKYCSFSILLIYSLEKRQTTLRHNNHTVQSK